LAAAACALSAVLAMSAPLGAAEETWLTLLRLQLRDEQRCDLSFVVSWRELPIEGLNTLEGRIRCLDGREYDFERKRPHLKFALRLCQPAQC
jgi:hypothetical protein